MPEISELKYMEKFVNRISKGKTFNCIGVSEVTKNPRPSMAFEEFTISAESRGKEMRLTINPIDQSAPIYLIMSMGMTGHWEESENIPDHCHLWFKETFDHHYLCYVDPRRFGRWKEQEEWSDNRGFDPVKEYSEFKQAVLDEQNNHLKGKFLFSTLMDQKYFNGIGNYLRAEILYRAFTDEDIKPTSTFDELEKTKIKKLIQIIRDVCKESYQVGGGEFISWENPEGKGSKEDFDNWLQCYRQSNMVSIKDKKGRTFWFHPDCQKDFEDLGYEIVK